MSGNYLIATINQPETSSGGVLQIDYTSRWNLYRSKASRISHGFPVIFRKPRKEFDNKELVIKFARYNHREFSITQLKEDHERTPQYYADIMLVHKFRGLVATWKEETGSKSIVSEKVVHPAYQQIISIGEKAIPLLLRELAVNPDHWFVALRSITGINPVKPEHRGRIKLMAKDWLDWGSKHGYEW
jgi:hypothetical protein